MMEDLSALDDGNGTVRLFPLPNVVMFPFVTQGLHIFEPRYRQMTADALAGDRLIGMVLLKPGWEEDYEGRPALYPVACLGKIVTHDRLDDGRYNLQLRGLSRARILEEVDSGQLYRCARVELLQDRDISSSGREDDLRGRVLQAVGDWLLAKEDALEVFRHFLKSNIRLGAVLDIISFALPFAIEFKQELLENPEVEGRVRAFLNYLETHEPLRMKDSGLNPFPPNFSSN